MYYYDWTYVVFVLPGLLIALWAQIKVNSAFRKYSTVYIRSGITGAEAARRILMQNGITDVAIERVSGKLTDHYDPKSNVIRLSDDVYGSTSAASVGVAAHEAGHAVQYAVGYSPIHLRSLLVPLTNIGSYAAYPLVLLGIVFSMDTLAFAGVLLFGAVVLFQLVTLPVEFNASRRAVEALDNYGIMSDDELSGTKKVLSAAAFTYLAGLITALLNMIRLIAIVGGRRDRK